MTSSGTPERTIGQLVADATADLQNIVRSEIDLATAEIKQDVTNGGKGAAMFIVAGVLGAYAFGLFLFGAAWLIEALTPIPLWGGLFIVMGVLLLIAAVLVLIGIKNVKRVKGKPQQAIAEAQATVAALKPSPKPEHSSV